MTTPIGMKKTRLRSNYMSVAAWDAVDEIGQKLLLLEAASAAAACLEQARKVLAALHDPSLEACPHVVGWDLAEDGAQLVIGGIHGAPLRMHNEWQAPTTEDRVLRLARCHVDLLAALHRAGFSGLQPTLDDVWWDATTGLFTLLGWESVREDLQSQASDWQSAACAWIELLTGAPPAVFPPLTVETAQTTWQAVSLGLRGLLVSLLLPRSTLPDPKQIAATINELADRWRRPLTDLRAEAQNIVADDPALAAELLDIIWRHEPESDSPARIAESTKRAREIVAHDLAEAQIRLANREYDVAAGALQRVVGLAQATPQQRLLAWRSWAFALAGQQIATKGSAAETDVFETTLPDLLRRVASSDEHRLTEDEVQHVAKALTELVKVAPAAAEPLTWLHAEWRAYHLIQGATACLTEDPTHAEQQFTAALADAETLPLPYRFVLIASVGDPAVGRQLAAERAVQARQLREAERDALKAEEKGDWAQAIELWQEATRCCDPTDERIAEFRRRAYAGQLRMQAMAAGVGQEPTELPPQALAGAFAALFGLMRAAPGDPWVQEHSLRWREYLLQETQRTPDGRSGSFLVWGWPEDHAVRVALEGVANKILMTWDRRLREIRDQQQWATPARLIELDNELLVIVRTIEAVGVWLEHVKMQRRADDLHQTAIMIRRQLSDLCSKQQEHRETYERAFVEGKPTRHILDQAAKLNIELYNDTQRSLAVLLSTRQDDASSWELGLVLAERAWLEGDVTQARQGFTKLVRMTQVPTPIQQTAAWALTVLDGVKTPSSSPERRSAKPIIQLHPIVFAALLVVAILIGLISDRWLPANPTPALTATSSKTPTTGAITVVLPRSTVKVTVAVSPTAASARAISDTVSLTPTVTLRPTITRTNTPTTTTTDTPSPTTKPTDTPSPKPTKTPTPTRRPITPPPSPLATPLLVEPSDGSNASSNVKFAWSWPGVPLGANQGFELLIWKQGEPHNGATSPTRETSLTLDMSNYPEGTYFWSVVLVQLQPYGRLSAEAAPRAINNPRRGPR